MLYMIIGKIYVNRCKKKLWKDNKIKINQKLHKIVTEEPINTSKDSLIHK
jgi:hypothetical protein